ncbi:MAG: dTDP-4-dehydrorhamnose reductase [Candidatus Atribacteria bacterium]|nr:dTDP-4-dehydrorhamnose reductase [Candidatus Atribacteria bacterium]MCD6349419.1 dTDP-4-dehydrorhamnose reductase [Candidatus Atribacteria bacterium]
MVAKEEGKEVKILLTGAGGQLGQAFQELFEKEGINYCAKKHKDLDITDLQLLREAIRGKSFTHIVNCAAFNDVDRAETEWKKAYLVNGIGVRNLAIVAQEENIELMHFSTDYVFDGQKGTPYTIFDPPSPLNRYGESKLLGEKLLSSLTSKWYLIRTSWVFGKGKRNFLYKVLTWSKKQDLLRIVSDEMSAPTYAKDLAWASYLLIRERAWGIYHITNTPTSRYQWAKYFLEKTGWKGRLEPARQEEFSLPAPRPKFSVLDNFGLRETTGFQMPTWEDATERFVKEEISK